MHRFVVAALLCGLAAPAFAQDVPGARDASQRFTSALSGADVPTALGFFTDDAVVLPPGRAPLTGKSEIQRFLGGMTHAVKNLKYTSDSLTPLDDTTAREVGSFTFQIQRQGKSNDVSGKYLLIWTKVGQDWKVAADMWNREGGNGGGGGRRGGAGAGGGAGGRGGAEGAGGQDE